MLTGLDAELFPDDCEVVEVPPHDLRIYLIQKNGSTAVKDEAMIKDWPIYSATDLLTLDKIDIFVRDPIDRFVSGIHTYAHHLVRDDPDLDLDTCMKMACRYAFLNRHYLPQWHWIANLARFTRPECQFRLHPLGDLKKYIVVGTRPLNVPDLDTETHHKILAHAQNIEFWFLIDKILVDLCGKELTWKDLSKVYDQHPTRPLDIISQQARSIIDVLC